MQPTISFLAAFFIFWVNLFVTALFCSYHTRLTSRATYHRIVLTPSQKIFDKPYR